MADFYKKGTPSNNFFGQATFGTEPNMRQELINTFDGKFPEIAKSQPGLLRRMRLTPAGKLIPCGCVDKVTNEPDKDRFCAICFGEAFLWDEVNIQLYRVLEAGDSSNTLRDKLHGPGLINAPLVVFYIRYDANITREDKIVTLELNDDGTSQSPLKRREIFRVETVWDYRSDNGKLEYFKVFAHVESVKHLNAPAYEDV